MVVDGVVLVRSAKSLAHGLAKEHPHEWAPLGLRGRDIEANPPVALLAKVQDQRGPRRQCRAALVVAQQALRRTHSLCLHQTGGQ